MTDANRTPEVEIADAVTGNWVDRYAPPRARPFLRLSRVDRPIGTWLLLLPCWWGLTLAMLFDQQPRWFDLWIFIGCGAGAWLMRGAGCTWNDITDRHIDDKVARTRSRPIPSGQVSVKGALGWMIAQSIPSPSALRGGPRSFWASLLTGGLCWPGPPIPAASARLRLCFMLLGSRGHCSTTRSMPIRTQKTTR